MKNKFFIVLTVICFYFPPWGGQRGAAQQVPHFTQYMLNDYLMNPSIAGSRDYLEVKTNGRYQWTGFPGAPKTVILSATGRYPTDNTGIGGVLFTDNTGLTARTGISASYAFHLQIAEETKLSMGLSLGLMQYRIDGTKLQLADPGEPGIPTGIESAEVPDGSFGFYLYNPAWFLGASSFHIFHNPLKEKYFNSSSPIYGYLTNHFFIMGGYKYEMDEKYSLQPTVLFKAVQPVPMQMELGIRTLYEDQYWLGISWRTQDAFSLLAGLNITDRFCLGYSYDLTLSGLRKFNSGSHEAMLSYKFNSPKRAVKKSDDNEEPFFNKLF